MLVFSVWEYTRFGKEYPHFWCVKVICTLVGLAVIPAVYYTYTGALGLSADWFNIAIFFIAAAAVYWLETKWLQREPQRCSHPFMALGILLLLALTFMLFTYFPPNLPLFQNPQQGKEFVPLCRIIDEGMKSVTVL